MLTGSVRIRGGDRKLLPIVSAAPIPRQKLLACAKLLMDMEVDAPVAEGQVVYRDILFTGIDIIAARDVASS